MASELIKLYYDKVIENGKHGTTTDGDKILHNLNKIDPERYEAYMNMLLEEGKATMFIATGRFVSVITSSLEERGKFMATMDLMKNEAFAEYKAAQSGGHDELFMAAFYVATIDYEKYYDKFELVEGDIPSTEENEE